MPSPPANSQEQVSIPLWGLLLPAVGILVVYVVLLVLGYRRHSRLSRNEANLRISRDRANVDLQMMSHQVQVRVQVHASGSPATGAAARRAAPRLRKLDGTGEAAEAGGAAAAAGAEEPITEPLS